MTRCIHTASSLDDPISVAYDEVVDALTYGDINEEVGLMRMGSNYTFLVRVRHEEKTLLGVYKPRMGERPLWDFPEQHECLRLLFVSPEDEADLWRELHGTSLGILQPHFWNFASRPLTHGPSQPVIGDRTLVSTVWPTLQCVPTLHAISPGRLQSSSLTVT